MAQLRVYGNLMLPVVTNEKAVQPKREERQFLKYAPKPSLTPVEGLIELELEKAVPRTTIKDLNFAALQYWLDHLGEALYNPIRALTGTKWGEYVFTDGDRRARALWEIGEPTIRVILDGYDPGPNYHSTAVSHFRENSKMKMRQFYPHIHPILPVLVPFFNDGIEGGCYKDTLSTPKSFGEIVATMPFKYYLPTVDAILGEIDVKGKHILDLGCRYGWASFLLWEAGERTGVVGVDIDKGVVEIMNAIASRRTVPMNKEGYVSAINCSALKFLQGLSKKSDVILMLNVLHHILVRDEAEGWETLNLALSKSDVVFVMTRQFEEVYRKFSGGIIHALEVKTGCIPKFLLKIGERELFKLERN